MERREFAQIFFIPYRGVYDQQDREGLFELW